MMTFDEWIVGEMDRGLSQFEADQMRAAWDAATLAEREACAKVCDEMFAGQVGAVHVSATRCASAIRMRSN